MKFFRLFRIAVCLTVIGLLSRPALALQLGESREQLFARHGAPGAEDRARNLAMYFWEGWSAQVEFHDNVVGKLTYRRNWYLQDPEIASLLAGNGGGERWKEVPSQNPRMRQWRRDDGATASCLREHPLSMSLYGPGTSAEPKVVIPASPATADGGFAKTPNYPRMLTAPAEPASVLTADHIASAPAQSLTTTELSSSRPADDTAEKQSAPAQTRPTNLPLPPLAPANSNPWFGLTLGLLAVGGAAGGFYYLRRHRPNLRFPVWTSPTRSTASAPSTPTSFSTATKAAKAQPATMESIPRLPEVERLRLDQFELLVGEIFRRQDYMIELSAATNANDGIDLVLRRDSECIMVQCKHWRTMRVTEREVREFYNAMAAGGAPRGVFATMGVFTQDAQAFAEGKCIELMDGNAIAECIQIVSRPGEDLCDPASWIDEFIANARIFDPECPVCHGTMVIRHGRATGAASWTCRNFPRCPGRREPRLDLLGNLAAH